jgi:hypothetical protein
MPVARTFLVGIALSLAAANAPVLAADVGVRCRYARTAASCVTPAVTASKAKAAGKAATHASPASGPVSLSPARQLREGKRTSPR